MYIWIFILEMLRWGLEQLWGGCLQMCLPGWVDLCGPGLGLVRRVQETDSTVPITITVTITVTVPITSTVTSRRVQKGDKYTFRLSPNFDFRSAWAAPTNNGWTDNANVSASPTAIIAMSGAIVKTSVQRWHFQFTMTIVNTIYNCNCEHNLQLCT